MDLSQEQKEVIKWYKGPLLVLGTPGSGKTTVIVERVRYLIESIMVRPENILVITFTRAAAESMKKRFLTKYNDLPDGDRVRFGTFHSFFYWIIRTAYGNKISLKVIDEAEKRQKIKEILRSMKRDDNEDVVSSILQQMDRLSCDMIDIEDYYSDDMPTQDFREIYQKYVEHKKNMGLIDFNDMVNECYKLLLNRGDILDRIRAMYPYILVDEYQDTNRIQYEILKMLAAPKFNLFCVGDDDQSIYGFRGARPDIMLSFKKDFKCAAVKELSMNYRCPQEVTALSSELISHNKKRYDKNLTSYGGHGNVKIDKPLDTKDEMNLIINRIKTVHDKGLDYTDIAVLFRTNSNPRRLIYSLRNAGIPYYVRDEMTDIFTHPAVRPVISYIRFASGDRSRKWFLDFMNKPVRYIERALLDNEEVDMYELFNKVKDRDYLMEAVNDLYNDIRRLEKMNPYAAVNYIRKAMGYDEYMKTFAEERGIDYSDIINELDEVQSIAIECQDYQEFFQRIKLYQELSQETSDNDRNKFAGVQLMTFHSAKGLEFTDVHIIDVVDGIIPHKKSRSDREIEEERRMLYVGMTRSMKNLYIYVPQSMDEKAVKPSKFL